jgi:enterobactin synthetase component D / holo-[acyl-carrier protein] synthase
VIEQILPGTVVSVDTTLDAHDVALFREEEQALGRAVDKRRREFTTGRACARAALAKLGLVAQAIGSGERGEPRWPAGVVGSITHCDGYRACAAARCTEIVTVGIDAEPHAPLPDGLLGDIARAEEIPALERLRRESPAVHWDRLLFSAKESVYKAWFPLARRWLGFEDAVLTLDPLACTFDARLLVPGPSLAGTQLQGFSGRWAVRDGLLLTAVALEAWA